MRSLAVLACLRSGKSRAELARVLGVSVRHVSRLLAGTSVASFETRRRAFERLGVPMLDWDMPSTASFKQGHPCPAIADMLEDVKRATVRLEDADEERIARLKGALALDGEELALSSVLAVLVRRGLDDLEAEIRGEKAPRKAG